MIRKVLTYIIGTLILLIIVPFMWGAIFTALFSNELSKNPTAQREVSRIVYFTAVENTSFDSIEDAKKIRDSKQFILNLPRVELVKWIDEQPAQFQHQIREKFSNYFRPYLVRNLTLLGCIISIIPFALVGLFLGYFSKIWIYSSILVGIISAVWNPILLYHEFTAIEISALLVVQILSINLSAYIGAHYNRRKINI